MADYARSLISKVIIDGDIIPAMSAGIRATWFEDSEHQRVFSWMLEYFTRYGATPTKKAFVRQFPAYRLVDVHEPYEYYIDHFRDQRKRFLLVDSVIAADAALKDGDHDAAQAELSRGLLAVGKEVSSLTDEDATAKLESRYEDYKSNIGRIGKLRGIATGFETLDYMSGGWQNQQVVYFGGQAKQCKSYMLLRSAMAAQDAGKKVLFMTFEMSAREQLTRWDGIAAGLNSKDLLQGNLEDDDLIKLRRGLMSRKHLPPFIVSADTSASTTISGLAAKIEQHRPDVVFIDGVYLMDNEVGAPLFSPQSFTAISRGIKRLAQRINKPIVGTIQALPGKVKDGVITLHSLGYSSAWAQDADVILGVERSEEDQLLAKLRVVAGRTISPKIISVMCDFRTSSFEEVDSSDDINSN